MACPGESRKGEIRCQRKEFNFFRIFPLISGELSQQRAFLILPPSPSLSSPRAGINHWTSNFVAYLKEVVALRRTAVITKLMKAPLLEHAQSHELHLQSQSSLPSLPLSLSLPTFRKAPVSHAIQWGDVYDLRLSFFSLKSKLCLPIPMVPSIPTHVTTSGHIPATIQGSAAAASQKEKDSSILIRIPLSPNGLGIHTSLLRAFTPSIYGNPPYSIQLVPSEKIRNVSASAVDQMRRVCRGPMLASLHLRTNKFSRCVQPLLDPDLLHRVMTRVFPIGTCLFVHSDSPVGDVIDKLKSYFQV